MFVFFGFTKGHDTGCFFMWWLLVALYVVDSLSGIRRVPQGCCAVRRVLFSRERALRAREGPKKKKKKNRDFHKIDVRAEN